MSSVIKNTEKGKHVLNILINEIDCLRGQKPATTKQVSDFFFSCGLPIWSRITVGV